MWLSVTGRVETGIQNLPGSPKPQQPRQYFDVIFLKIKMNAKKIHDEQATTILNKGRFLPIGHVAKSLVGLTAAMRAAPADSAGSTAASI